MSCKTHTHTLCIYIWMCSWCSAIIIYVCTCDVCTPPHTGWRRLIGCLELQVILRSLSAKEPLIIGLFCGKWPYKDKASYASSPPCTLWLANAESSHFRFLFFFSIKDTAESRLCCVFQISTCKRRLRFKSVHVCDSYKENTTHMLW